MPVAEQGMGRSDRLRLWSIRDVLELDALDRGRPLRSDPSLVKPEFKDAYDWMAGKFAERWPPPSGVRYPLWAWWRAQGQAKARPDLRKSWGEPGQRLALVEFEMPDHAVLLSDYQTWHFPLNKWCLHKTARDERNFNDRLQAAGVADQWPYPEPFASEVVRSWDLIFSWTNLDPAFHEPHETMQIQAVIWEIPADAIRSVRQFRSR